MSRRLLVVLTLAGCAGKPAAAPTPPTPAPGPPAVSCPPVQALGSMERFRDGDLSQTVDLSDLAWTPTTIALGATTGKTAEITAADGTLWVVAPAEQGVDVAHDAAGHGGSLLVVATPAGWDEGRTVDGSDTTAILAGVGAARAETACAEADAVPFLVRGHADALTWSIVGQPSGTQGSEQDVDVVIVGVWAPGARGTYVPGSMDGHLHVVVPSKNIAGHLVSVRLADGANLHLPVAED